MSDNGTDKALPDDDNVASPPSSEPDMDDQLQSSDPPEEEKSSEDPPSLRRPQIRSVLNLGQTTDQGNYIRSVLGQIQS
jgi:hypothetical protein